MFCFGFSSLFFTCFCVCVCVCVLLVERMEVKNKKGTESN